MVRRFLGKKKYMIKSKDTVTAKPKDDPTCLGHDLVHPCFRIVRLAHIHRLLPAAFSEMRVRNYKKHR